MQSIRRAWEKRDLQIRNDLLVLEMVCSQTQDIGTLLSLYCHRIHWVPVIFAFCIGLIYTRQSPEVNRCHFVRRVFGFVVRFREIFWFVRWWWLTFVKIYEIYVTCFLFEGRDFVIEYEKRYHALTKSLARWNISKLLTRYAG